MSQDDGSHSQRHRQEAANHDANEENLRDAIVASECDARRHAHEVLEYEEQLKQVIKQSLSGQWRRRGASEWESDTGLNNGVDEVAQVTNKREWIAETSTARASSSAILQSPWHDPGHLAGITQSEYKAQQQGQQREKTAQEKTEEEIVMEYVKKQSLLEQKNRIKGKGRASATEYADDEDLPAALEFSMQWHKHDADDQYGEFSGT